MQAFGVSAEEAADLAGPPPKVLFDVLPENADAVALFLDCSTQWHYNDAGPTGLRYESVLAVMDVCAVKDKRGMLNDLRTMERAALASRARQ